MIPVYEFKSAGNYCLASDIGGVIKTILNDRDFFRRRSNDGSERIGRWINEEATEIFKKNRHGAVEAMDIISLNYSDNSALIDKLTDDRRVDPSVYRRHGKLDMYSVNLAQLIIRSMTGILDYRIEADIELNVDYRHIPCKPVHNDIAMKYLIKTPKASRLLNRKTIIHSINK